MSFKIEKGIKPPEILVKRKNRAWFWDMEIGDSALVDSKTRDYMRTAFRAKKWGFASEAEGGKHRVWRVEPTNA